MSDDATDRVVLRSRFGVWTTGVVGVFVLWLLIDAAVRGAWPLVLLASPWLLAVLTLCWSLLVRPCVEVRRDGLRIVNLVRTHHVAWADIGHLTVRYQLVVERTDGRVLRAWGSPTVERRRPDDHDDPTAHKRPFSDVVTVIEQARAELGTTESTSWTRIVWWPFALVVALYCLGALIASLLG